MGCQHCHFPRGLGENIWEKKHVHKEHVILKKSPKIIISPIFLQLNRGENGKHNSSAKKTTSKLRFLVRPGTINFSPKNRILSCDPILYKVQKYTSFLLLNCDARWFFYHSILGWRISILQMVENGQAIGQVFIHLARHLIF